MLPSGRAFEHGGMCVLVAQTMASELLLEGEGALRLSKPSNFFIKREGIFVCACPRSALRGLSSSDGRLYFLSLLQQQRRRRRQQSSCFFVSQACSILTREIASLSVTVLCLSVWVFPHTVTGIVPKPRRRLTIIRRKC